MGPIDSVLGVLQDHFQVPQSARRVHRTGHIADLMTMIYYSERIQSKISKGKGTWDRDQRKPGANFQQSHRMLLILPATNWDICEMLSTREAH